MANSTMSRNELAKVLNDATSASLNSSQKLHCKKHQSNRVLNTDPVLTSPAHVPQKIVLSGHNHEVRDDDDDEDDLNNICDGAGDTFDHIEGPMPNTSKYMFDSTDKNEKEDAVAEIEVDVDNDDYADRMLEETAVFSDSQDATIATAEE